MARRPVKKGSLKKQIRGRETGAPESPASQPTSGTSKGNISFGKFFVFILIVLGVLYGPSFFKNGLQSAPKYFLVKKVLQFTGTETQGKPFFANDIVEVSPNELAITDNLGSQVLIYDFKGKLIRKWGKHGTGPMEFQEPSGIATDRKSRLYVLDTWNGAVKAFDLKGKLTQTLDLTHFGFFYGPRRVGWGGDSVMVSNASNSRLARVSLTGELLSVWDGKELGGVSGAIVDGKGHTYVGDMDGKNSRVQVFDSTGKVIQTIKTEVPPEDIALDSKGRLFVGCYGDSSKVFDGSGKWLGFLADEAQPTLPLGQVMGIDITPDDLILTCGGDLVTIYQVAGEKEK